MSWWPWALADTAYSRRPRVRLRASRRGALTLRNTGRLATMMKRLSETGSVPLEGEDIGTIHWEDARHWLTVYAELLRFKTGVLDRVGREMPQLPQGAQRAASQDLDIISAQMLGYQARLDLWYQRVWDLQGLWIDPEG